MRKIVLILLVLIGSFGFVRSQGFDWQYSPRLPFKSPNLFAGVTLGYIQGNNSGSFDFLQNYTLCCSFANGMGSGIKFGVAGEWWIRGSLALDCELFYHTTTSNFSSQDSVPTREYLIRRNYDFNSSQSFLGISIGAKKRLLGSHFSVLLGTAVEFETSDKNAYTYSIVAPDSLKTGSQIITNGNIAGYNKLLIVPYAGIALDLPLSEGLYSEMSLKLSTPVSDVIDDGNWRRYDVLFGVKVYLGLPSH